MNMYTKFGDYTVFHKKMTHNFGKCSPIFIIFQPQTQQLMRNELKIASHLKRVDTVPCKTVVFKN